MQLLEATQLKYFKFLFIELVSSETDGLRLAVS